MILYTFFSYFKKGVKPIFAAVSRVTYSTFSTFTCMCIISVVSSEHKTILTFNRDESPDRLFADPQIDTGTGIFCPVDLQSGGTWIGLNTHHIIGLQNGGKEKHVRKAIYGRSRGLLLRDILQYGISELDKFVFSTDYEPFTISSLHRETGAITVYSFNGEVLEKEMVHHDPCFIRFSSTLYNADMQAHMGSAFKKLPYRDEATILEFHKSYRIGGALNLLQRPSTTSITQFVLENGNADCQFYNLISGRTSLYNAIEL